MSVSDDIVEVGNASVDDVFIQIRDTTADESVDEFVGTDMIGTHYIPTTLEHVYSFRIIGNDNTAINPIESNRTWSVADSYYRELVCNVYADPNTPVKEVTITQMVLEKVSI